MAVQTKVGAFQSLLTTGNQAITGVGFQPQALVLFTCKNHVGGSDPWNTNTNVLIGFATSSTQRMVVSGRGDGSGNAGRVHDATKVAWYANTGDPASDGQADFVSFNADGFTINWTEAPSFQVYTQYVAFAGLTNAKAVSFAPATATGNQAVTGVGFQPDALIFASAVISGATAVDHKVAVGFADAGLNQAANYTSNPEVATSNVSGYQRSDRCIVLPSHTAADTTDAEASIVSMDSDGFTVNWSDAITDAGRAVICLALKGGNWRVGTETQRTSTGTKATTGLAFQPTGLVTAGIGTAGSTALQTTNGRFQFGASDGTSHQGLFSGIQDGASGASGIRYRSATTCLVAATPPTSTVLAEAAVSSFGSDGFTLNWTTADATAREFIYLAAGGPPPSVPSLYVVQSPLRLA